MVEQTDKQKFLSTDESVFRAINKMSAASGMPFTAHLQKPSGIIVIVAYPDGTLKMKAEHLPAGRELDYAIAMLDEAKNQLQAKRMQEVLESGSMIQTTPEVMPSM